MKTAFVLLFLTILIFCSDPKEIKENLTIESSYEKIKNIEINNLKNIDAIIREQDFVILRYYEVNDSIGTPFILRKDTNNRLLIKSAGKWLNLDDIEKDSNFLRLDISKKKILNDFTIIKNLDATEIVSDENELFILISGVSWYHIFNDSMRNKYASIEGAKEIDKNWWFVEHCSPNK